jgi:hypothetical protein
MEDLMAHHSLDLFCCSQRVRQTGPIVEDKMWERSFRVARNLNHGVGDRSARLAAHRLSAVSPYSSPDVNGSSVRNI